ncbi:unnamed protein product, partial [Brassica napus]
MPIMTFNGLEAKKRFGFILMKNKIMVGHCLNLSPSNGNNDLSTRANAIYPLGFRRPPVTKKKKKKKKKIELDISLY